MGVSGTKIGVEVGRGFCGVGSSSRTRTVGFGFGFGFEFGFRSGSVRRFLQWNSWNGDESSSSERTIGSDMVIGNERSAPNETVRSGFGYAASASNKRGIVFLKSTQFLFFFLNFWSKFQNLASIPPPKHCNPWVKMRLCV